MIFDDKGGGGVGQKGDLDDKRGWGKYFEEKCAILSA